MYQEQLLKLIDERAALERAIGENKTRIDQALLLIGALDEVKPEPSVTTLTRRDESGRGSGGWSDPLSQRTFVRRLLAERGSMKVGDILLEVQRAHPGLKVPRFRMLIHRLKEEGHIVRHAKATYGPPVQLSVVNG